MNPVSTANCFSCYSSRPKSKKPDKSTVAVLESPSSGVLSATGISSTIYANPSPKSRSIESNTSSLSLTSQSQSSKVDETSTGDEDNRISDKSRFTIVITPPHLSGEETDPEMPELEPSDAVNSEDSSHSDTRDWGNRHRIYDQDLEDTTDSEGDDEEPGIFKHGVQLSDSDLEVETSESEEDEREKKLNFKYNKKFVSSETKPSWQKKRMLKMGKRMKKEGTWYNGREVGYYKITDHTKGTKEFITKIHVKNLYK